MRWLVLLVLLMGCEVHATNHATLDTTWCPDYRPKNFDK